jgi:hypothetical protein
MEKQQVKEEKKKIAEILDALGKPYMHWTIQRRKGDAEYYYVVSVAKYFPNNHTYDYVEDEVLSSLYDKYKTLNIREPLKLLQADQLIKRHKN